MKDINMDLRIYKISILPQNILNTLHFHLVKDCLQYINKNSLYKWNLHNIQHKYLYHQSNMIYILILYILNILHLDSVSLQHFHTHILHFLLLQIHHYKHYNNFNLHFYMINILGHYSFDNILHYSLESFMGKHIYDQ